MAPVFLNLLQEVRSVSAQVIVIATVWYKNHLNQYLLQSRGFHVFDRTLELHPPTLVRGLSVISGLLIREEWGWAGSGRRWAPLKNNYDVASSVPVLVWV